MFIRVHSMTEERGFDDDERVYKVTCYGVKPRDNSDLLQLSGEVTFYSTTDKPKLEVGKVYGLNLSE